MDQRDFWDSVHIENDECWVWTRWKNNHGYGVAQFNGGRQYVHRIAYALWYGEDPGKMCVLHRCDNPPCVRPDHLFLGTRKDNSRDMVEKHRGALQREWVHHNKKKTHCLRGHEFNEANTYIDSRGNRNCKACRDMRVREWAQMNPGRVKEASARYRRRRKEGKS